MSPSSDMSRRSDGATRHFGDASVTIVNHFSLLSPPDEVPQAIRDWGGLLRRADGTVVWPMNGVVVRTPSATVVVDPGGLAENDVDPSRFERGTGIDAALDALAISSEDVTHVVITHGHVDHFVGVLADDPALLRFPNAEHVFPALDRDAASAVIEPVEAAGLLRLVEGDAPVCPGVDVLSTPGESPGHQVVRATGPAGSFYFLGDLVHVTDEIDHVDWVSFPDECDGRLLLSSRERVFSDQGDAPGTFVFAHGPFPGWGRIERAGDGWRWRPEEVAQ